MAPALNAHAPLLRLSPSGNLLAIAGTQSEATVADAQSLLLLFDVGKSQGRVWGNPTGKIPMAGIALLALEWGPDEQEMAMLIAPGQGLRLETLKIAGGPREILAAPTLNGGQVINMIENSRTMRPISWAP
jgi:hypothetical protein